MVESTIRRWRQIVEWIFVADISSKKGKTTVCRNVNCQFDKLSHQKHNYPRKGKLTILGFSTTGWRVSSNSFGRL